MSGALKPMELDLDVTSGQLVYVPMPNFSYNYIPEGCCVKVPEYQEMVLSDTLEVNGTLNLQGDLSFFTSVSGFDTIKEWQEFVPTKLSQLEDDSNHRTVTDAEKAQWNGSSSAFGDIPTDVKMNGTQSVGSLDLIARIDHIHPTDTSKVSANASITGATKTKLTYDSKGLITSGTDATTADISDSLNKRYITDAQLTLLGNTSGINTGDQVISDATISTTDISTNDVSNTKHGFFPKITGTPGQYVKVNAGGTGLDYGSPTGGGTPASTVVSETSFGQSTVVGTSTNYAREDHSHGTPSSTGLVVSNAPISAATKTKITYDVKGLVTAGADATTADISDSSNRRYVTDAQLVVIGNTTGTNSGDETQSTIKTKLGVASTGVDGYLSGTDWTTFNNKVTGNTAITGATKTKITYDTKGLVTSGTDATTADIADSSNKRYVTDAQLTVLSNTSGTNTGDQVISDATITTSDITTNDVTNLKHGFFPKITGSPGQYVKVNTGGTGLEYGDVTGGSGLSQAQVLARISLRV